MSVLAQDRSYVRDEASLLGAEQQLLSSCMSEAGFTYLAVDGERLVTPLFDSVPDLEHRSAVGYGISDAAPPANDEYVRSLPAEAQSSYREALFGAGESVTVDLPDGSQQVLQSGGCVGAARTEIYGSLANWILIEPVMSAHANLVGRALGSDARFARAMVSWSTCMDSRGYSFLDPQAAHDHVEELVASGAPDARATEIAVAVDDAECAIDSGVPEVINELASEYLDSLAADDRGDVDEAVSLRAAAVDRARSLLGEG